MGEFNLGTIKEWVNFSRRNKPTEIKKTEPLWDVAGPYGDVGALESQGAGVYINLDTSVKPAKSIEYMAGKLGQTIMDNSQGMGINRESVQKAAQALKEHEMLVAFGIDYHQSMDGFPVGIVIRNQGDIDLFIRTLHPKRLVVTSQQLLQPNLA